MILKYISRLFIFLFVFSLLPFSCKKDKKETPPIETGSVTDVNGNTYKTVKIGNQWWMAENLKATKLNHDLPARFMTIKQISDLLQ